MVLIKIHKENQVPDLNRENEGDVGHGSVLIEASSTKLSDRDRGKEHQHHVEEEGVHVSFILSKNCKK